MDEEQKALYISVNKMGAHFIFHQIQKREFSLKKNLPH